MVVMPDGGRGLYTNAIDGDAYEDDLLKDVIGPGRADVPGQGRAFGPRHRRALHGRLRGDQARAEAPGAVRQRQFAFRRRGLPARRASSGTRSTSPSSIGSSASRRPAGPRTRSPSLERIDHGRIPAMRIDCGTDDFLLDQNRAFHAQLESLHVPHEYQEFPGGHDWGYWDKHVQEAIAFHARNLTDRSGSSG